MNDKQNKIKDIIFKMNAFSTSDLQDGQEGKMRVLAIEKDVENLLPSLIEKDDFFLKNLLLIAALRSGFYSVAFHVLDKGVNNLHNHEATSLYGKLNESFLKKINTSDDLSSNFNQSQEESFFKFRDCLGSKTRQYSLDVNPIGSLLTQLRIKFDASSLSSEQIDLLCEYLEGLYHSGAKISNAQHNIQKCLEEGFFQKSQPSCLAFRLLDLLKTLGAEEEKGIIYEGVGIDEIYRSKDQITKKTLLKKM